MIYTSPLLSRPSATELAEPGPLDAAGVAWHYGNPLGEQRVVERGSAIIDRSHRFVISVTGQDAPEFLNNLLSQKLDDVASGYSAGALDLDMQGRILHQAKVSRTAEGFYLDTPSAQGESFLDFLTKMVFWSQVEVSQAEVAVITVLGAPLDAPEGALVARDVEWLGSPRQDFLVPSGQLEASVADLESQGGKLAGLMAFTAERVKALEPEREADLDDKSIPHEVPHWIGRGGRLGAVHLNKGCYRGQETVARVDNLGRSPRLLVMLQLDGSCPVVPQPGQPVTAGTRTVGRLGTVVEDCDNGPIALALVKRSALDSQLNIGEVAVSVDPDSIQDDEGPKAGRAAVNRLRGL